MPRLEHVTNEIKAEAWKENNIRTRKTFEEYSDSMKIAVLRATAGALSYMNNPRTVESFYAQSDCMRNTWDRWWTAYRTDLRPPQAAKDFDITTKYSTWIVNREQKFVSTLEAGFNNMFSWWNEDAGGQGVKKWVQINWINELTEGDFVPISGNDINTMIQHVQPPHK